MYFVFKWLMLLPVRDKETSFALKLKKVFSVLKGILGRKEKKIFFLNYCVYLVLSFGEGMLMVQIPSAPVNHFCIPTHLGCNLILVREQLGE